MCGIPGCLCRFIFGGVFRGMGLRWKVVVALAVSFKPSAVLHDVSLEEAVGALRSLPFVSCKCHMFMLRAKVILPLTTILHKVIRATAIIADGIDNAGL